MSAKVLIVDDSLTVRMDLAEAFESAGFAVLPCASVMEAKEVLARERVDVAILDVVLPDGDGVELLSELRRLTPDRHVVVLMLSSEVEVRDRMRGLEKGADEYVGKPYDRGYVLARTRELIQQQKKGDRDRPILLIDDSPTFRAVLTEALEQDGYRVSIASSGEEGLRVAAVERPDAIIVDGVLPGMDGSTVIRHVRLDAALRRVVCLLLTDTNEIDAELRALDSGADAFVNKREDPAVLLAKLRAVLRMAQDTRSDDETRSLLSPSRILAVDDSATYREAVGAALRAEGYDVIQVASGEEALDILSIQSVDCVLLDLMMPGIGGTETCRRIKASPVARDIPVIVLTSLDDRAAMLETLGTGADDYIQKSAELDVLKARVRAQLRRRQFEDETRRVRERLLRSEIEAAESRRAREIAEVRLALVEELERKNGELNRAMGELQTTQSQLVQAAKMASLGGLVAGIAHEINNPLAFSLSHLSTVKKSLGKAEAALGAAIESEPVRDSWKRARSRLDEMTTGLERIRELVVKLRTFSHIDEGEWRKVSMRECIDSVLTILAHRIRERIEISTEFGEPDSIDCYPSLLNQAVMNLISNSIDAIAEQGRISVRTGAVDGQYEIQVSDTGCGIPAEHRDRVLEPFFTTKPVGEGTGLGLSITYSIVRKHGGTLAITCPETGGTTVTIRIPFRTTAHPSSIPLL
ncbi:MAG TPA: response regulator [Polyangiaceae bacterium]|nr:response regulator [Polyangiaceae bacterium]